MLSLDKIRIYRTFRSISHTVRNTSHNRRKSGYSVLVYKFKTFYP